jgi:hypothetical protein
MPYAVLSVRAIGPDRRAAAASANSTNIVIYVRYSRIAARICNAAVYNVSARNRSVPSGCAVRAIRTVLGKCKPGFWFIISVWKYPPECG